MRYSIYLKGTAECLVTNLTKAEADELMELVPNPERYEVKSYIPKNAEV